MIFACKHILFTCKNDGFQIAVVVVVAAAVAAAAGVVVDVVVVVCCCCCLLLLFVVVVVVVVWIVHVLRGLRYRSISGSTVGCGSWWDCLNPWL